MRQPYFYMEANTIPRLTQLDAVLMFRISKVRTESEDEKERQGMDLDEHR